MQIYEDGTNPWGVNSGFGRISALPSPLLALASQDTECNSTARQTCEP
jgi:hypothetical protein